MGSGHINIISQIYYITNYLNIAFLEKKLRALDNLSKFYFTFVFHNFTDR